LSSLKLQSPQPSRYLTDEYLDELIAWRNNGQHLGQSNYPAVWQECMMLLHYEARLLDERRFEEWLNLLTPDCLYWAPMDDASDPRRTINVAFDDRRRLEDRIIRLGTGFAHNQEPDRRMRHLINNIEAWEAADRSSRRVRAQETVYEHRTGRETICFLAALDYWLVPDAGMWKIKVKRAVLLNSLDGLDTPTLL
jgi:3-phenylpropionate/cinnamic acid dioxygenase small subunit